MTPKQHKALLDEVLKKGHIAPELKESFQWAMDELHRRELVANRSTA